MADVVNRITKEYRRSVNDPDYPIENWILNPDLSAVIGFESKYWIITGDVVSLMDAGQRQVVDDAELSASRDQVANSIQRVGSFDRAFAEILLDEINILRAAVVPPLSDRTLNQLRNALRSKLV